MAVRLPPVSSRKRSSSAAAIRAGCIMRTRAAASSMRERDPVETIDDLADRRRRLGVGNEAGPGLLRPLDEQRDRGRRVERRHPPRHLAGDAHRLATRRQHAQARARVQQRLDHPGRRVEHLLAVVDDEQRVEIAQLLRQRVDERTTELLAQTEHPGDRLGDVAAVADRGELRAPHAVGERVELVGRGVQRESRLAAAAGAGERHQPVLAHGLTHRRDLGVATDEARNLRGQVRRHRAERPQRRELVSEIGVHELPDPLGPPEILQSMQSQIAELGVVRKRVDDEIARRVRDQRLAAVTDRTHARAPDDRRTEVVPGITEADLARVQRHPHPHRATVGPGLLRERALHVERRGHRVRRPRERPDHAVALTLLHRPGTPHAAKPPRRAARSAARPKPRSRRRRASHSFVEPSMSVRRNVTVPVGSSDATVSGTSECVRFISDLGHGRIVTAADSLEHPPHGISRPVTAV